MRVDISEKYKQHTGPQYKTSFTSKKFPVEPFEVVTKKGKILIRELSKDEIGPAVRFSMEEAQKTFALIDNFWKDMSESKKALTAFMTRQLYKGVLESDEGTILVGTIGEKQDIKALFLLRKPEENHLKPLFSKLFNNEKTGIFEEFMVDEECRGQGLGKICVDKLFQTAKSFSQIFLTANKLATGFYEKLGFKELNINYLKSILSDNHALDVLCENYDINIVIPMVKVLE